MNKKMVYGRIKDVEFYEPGGHSDTKNQRLLGPFNGSDDAEVIIGQMGPTGTADSHKHDDFDQIVVMLEGKFHVVTPDIETDIEAGDYLMFPKGVEHQINVIEPSKFVLIYAPPRQKK